MHRRATAPRLRRLAGLNATVVEATSYLLERVFEERLPGDGDLHMAGEGV